MKAAIYARVSKEQGQDTENQLRELRHFAKSQGWQIIEYVDYATGKHAEREAFKRMFEDAGRRKFDVVLFWSLDRFTREGALPTLQHLEKLTGYGVGYRSFTEPYLDSCGIFKDAVIAIIGTVAKQERIRISERTKAGLARARANGRIGGRPGRVFDRLAACEKRAAGMSWRAIGAELGIPHSTVRKEVTGIIAERMARKAHKSVKISLKTGVHKTPAQKPLKRAPIKR